MSGFEVGTFVAYAPIKESLFIDSLYPIERQLEVDKCKNESARREKYYVWKLLEKVVRMHLNCDFANLKFTKTDNGQWICPDFYFSLSHTNGLVCVAVSDEPIGVDAEFVRDINPDLKGKILTDRELLLIEKLEGGDTSRYLLESWVKKESIFKKTGGKALLPNRTEVSEHHTEIKIASVGDEQFIISVACNENKKITFEYMEDI